MRYTKKDILEMVEEEDVEFVRLQFTDLFGNMKNVAITASHLKKALDNKVMFDGSSAEGFVRVEESDMYLYPDYGTFATFPWRAPLGKVARRSCAVYRPDGTCYEGDPRYILKHCRQQITLAHLSLWSKLSRSAMVFMQPLCQSRKMVWMVPACILTCLCPVTAETFSRTAMILTD